MEESEDQLRTKHIRDMGAGLGAVYHALYNDIAWLHAKWIQYRQLYAHSPERVDLLNTLAGHFFRVVQDTTHDDVLLHLTRLTDRRRDTLSLRTLHALIPDRALASEVETLIQAAVNACDSARASRNQRIAHTNRMRALASTFDPNPSRADVEAALNAVRAVLNRLERHYWQSEVGYQYFIASGGDADSLVYYLLNGVRAEERRMERLLQGKPLPEDLQPEDDSLIARQTVYP